MAISGFSLNMTANKPVTKMQREIKDIQVSPNVKNIIPVSPPKHRFQTTSKFGSHR